MCETSKPTPKGYVTGRAAPAPVLGNRRPPLFSAAALMLFLISGPIACAVAYQDQADDAAKVKDAMKELTTIFGKPTYAAADLAKIDEMIREKVPTTEFREVVELLEKAIGKVKTANPKDKLDQLDILIPLQDYVRRIAKTLPTPAETSPSVAKAITIKNTDGKKKLYVVFGDLSKVVEVAPNGETLMPSSQAETLSVRNLGAWEPYKGEVKPGGTLSYAFAQDRWSAKFTEPTPPAPVIVKNTDSKEKLYITYGYPPVPPIEVAAKSELKVPAEKAATLQILVTPKTWEQFKGDVPPGATVSYAFAQERWTVAPAIENGTPEPAAVKFSVRNADAKETLKITFADHLHAIKPGEAIEVLVSNFVKPSFKDGDKEAPLPPSIQIKPSGELAFNFADMHWTPKFVDKPSTPDVTPAPGPEVTLRNEDSTQVLKVVYGKDAKSLQIAPKTEKRIPLADLDPLAVAGENNEKIPVTEKPQANETISFSFANKVWTPKIKRGGEVTGMNGIGLTPRGLLPSTSIEARGWLVILTTTFQSAPAQAPSLDGNEKPVGPTAPDRSGESAPPQLARLTQDPPPMRRTCKSRRRLSRPLRPARFRRRRPRTRTPPALRPARLPLKSSRYSIRPRRW